MSGCCGGVRRDFTGTLVGKTPQVSVKVLTPQGPKEWCVITAVVDTGFAGELLLDRKSANDLSLPLVGVTVFPGATADGSDLRAEIRQAEIILGSGGVRTVHVIVPDVCEEQDQQITNLVGTELFVPGCLRAHHPVVQILRNASCPHD